MGSAKSYNSGGGFSKYEYHQIGETIYYDGLKGKIIAKMDAAGRNDLHAGMPKYSDTSDFYAKVGGRSGKIIQVKFFKSRAESFDFDWGHDHPRGDGTFFHKGVVHVQQYAKDGRRGSNTRYMNNAEIKKYGRLLKMLDPSVKFRP